ncbi:DinB family protein [Paenibacillus barcinonensis]|uniref:DinB family protein n=1 Tax=Paenibacillus barcinonensis TaxID=198119 RepID=A0A2V4W338_PAEBA|nr:DinB family protein [Paenibacillus barcinonensis]PYE45545.1 DinB family protein [Paenibacillus barcinonensis]QKS58973.1 DinB family protein [Paenibacillus barcinonensis]
MFERNDHIRNQIWEAISGLDEHQLNQKPSPEQWSIIQVLRHLNLMENLITTQARRSLENEENVSIDKKPYELSLDRSRSVEAPPHLQPLAAPESLADIRSDLEASHRALEQFAQEHETSQLRSKSFPHPVFGEMDLAQWIDFTSYHEERHLGQIQEIKHQLGL